MKIGFITVCSDNYVDGVIALIKSLKRNQKDFNYIFRIIYHPIYCKLSEESKLKLKTYYNFEFIEVDINEFKINSNIKIKHDRLNFACFLSLMAFNQPDLDRVIFIDSDMIVLNDISEIIKIDYNFAAVLDKDVRQKFWTPVKKDNDINAGLMVINSVYNNKETFRRLTELMNNQRMVKLVDQDIINKFFKNKDIMYLPLKYNKQVKKNYKNKKCYDETDVILHFCGPKPWHGGTKSCVEIEKTWWDYFNI